MKRQEGDPGETESMILISGEALIDLIPDPDQVERLRRAARRLALQCRNRPRAGSGAPTGFISRISADGNGEALAASLAENGVDLGYVARDARPTMLAFVMRGTAKTGSRYSFYVDATAYDGPWPFPAEWPKGARHLHVGSVAAVDSRHGQSVLAALTAARPHATISFDPNIRPLVTPDRDAVALIVEREVSLAHLVKASQEDLEWLYPDRGVEESLAAWAKSGPQFCVATLGERGALAMLGERAHRGSGAASRGRRHRRRRRQLHVRALVGDGPRPRARRCSARALSKRTRKMAALCGGRFCDHLHAQGLRSADARGSRGGARGMIGNSPQR